MTSLAASPPTLRIRIEPRSYSCSDADDVVNGLKIDLLGLDDAPERVRAEIT
jgi:hypothetical protein